MIISQFFSFSLIKCLSNSTCLVLSWSTRLCEIAIAALLSQKTFIGKGLVVLSSSSNYLIHKTSQIPCDTALNSASVLLSSQHILFFTMLSYKISPNNYLSFVCYTSCPIYINKHFKLKKSLIFI